MNPPDLVPFTAFGGDWPAYETELHRIFIAEIARSAFGVGRSIAGAFPRLTVAGPHFGILYKKDRLRTIACLICAAASASAGCAG